MNVFDLDRSLVRDYARFARSFTQIRAPDIRQQVEAIYATNRFWPDPLISINPRFEHGASIDELADAGTLHKATAHVFAAEGKPLSLYRHQAQAIAKALSARLRGYWSKTITNANGPGSCAKKARISRA
ncbi:MAG: hypothetical protein ACLPTZ_08515 [Beijerinckiaceae bacterium]